MKRQPRYFLATICVLIAAFPGERLSHSAYSQAERPKINIEGTWTCIYRDWENSIACMLPGEKGTTGSVGGSDLTIMRDIAIIHSGSPVGISAYELRLENGVTYFDLIPLDKDGKKIEKDRLRGIVVLNDDLLFVTLGTKKRVTSLSVSADGSERLLVFRRGAMRYIPGVGSAGDFSDEKR